jgi:drug/metabolite transporter (DMT)-like permease
VAGEVIAAGFGLLSAAIWGAGDFSGGLASRRASLLSVTVVTNAVGASMALIYVLVRGAPVPPASDLVLGAVAGLAGVIGILALYRAMSLGRMGIAAPVTAVVANVFSVGWGAASEGLPGPLRILGFALACLGVWFVAQPDGGQGRPKGLGLAALSGLGFGAFFIALGQISPDTDSSWPILSARVTSFAIILIAFFSSRQAFSLEPSARLLAVGAGVWTWRRC